MTSEPNRKSGPSAATTARQRLRFLEEQLAEAKALVAALVAGQVDTAAVAAGTAPMLLVSAQEALVASEKRFRALIEHSWDAIALFGRDARILYASPSTRRILGFEVSDVVGRVPLDRVHPDDRGLVRERLAESTGRPGVGIEVNARVRHKDGSWRYLEGVFTNLLDDPAVGAVVNNYRDATERHRTDERLGHLAAVVESSDDAIIGTTPEGTITSWNAGAERMYGYTSGEVAGLPVAILAPPDRSDEVSDILARLRRGERTRHFETVRRRRDGSLVHVSLSVSPILDDRARLVGVSAIARDIDAQKRAEAALRASDERYRRIVETAHEGIWVVDANAITTYVNERMAEMLGYSVDEMTGRSSLDFMDVETRPEVQERLAGRRAGQTVDQYELRLRRRDGSTLWTLVSGRRLTDETGAYAGSFGMLADITERKSLEEQFLQAQKMEAVGRLAGGIAHDFNNLLGVILGYGTLALNGVSDPKVRSRIDEMVKAGERAAGLTRQLLAFSRKQVLEPKVIDLNALVSDVEKMLRRVIGEDIHLATVTDERLGRVKADPGKMEQVLMNLAINARDAMPKGGHVTIETAHVELDEAYAAEQPGVRPGPYVVLAVSDTGTGMDAETTRHIFEPFFSTKGPGRGTGLGLSMAYGTVKQSGGHIAVYSEPGRGTTFKVYLPRLDAATELPVAAPDPPRPGGTETILVVEDSDSLRELTCEQLREHGYTVVSASSGGLAAERSAAEPGPIDLLLTDVVMPGMGGRDLAEILSERRPGMKVLFMSGYTDDAVIRHGVLSEGMAFIQKPFQMSALLSKVREVLDGRPGSAIGGSNGRPSMRTRA